MKTIDSLDYSGVTLYLSTLLDGYAISDKGTRVPVKLSSRVKVAILHSIGINVVGGVNASPDVSYSHIQIVPYHIVSTNGSRERCFRMSPIDGYACERMHCTTFNHFSRAQIQKYVRLMDKVYEAGLTQMSYVDAEEVVAQSAEFLRDRVREQVNSICLVTFCTEMVRVLEHNMSIAVKSRKKGHFIDSMGICAIMKDVRSCDDKQKVYILRWLTTYRDRLMYVDAGDATFNREAQCYWFYGDIPRRLISPEKWYGIRIKFLKRIIELHSEV